MSWGGRPLNAQALYGALRRDTTPLARDRTKTDITTAMNKNKAIGSTKKSGSLHNAPHRQNKTISNKDIFEPSTGKGNTMNKSLKVNAVAHANISNCNIPLALAKKLNEARKEFLFLKNLAEKEKTKQTHIVRPHSLLGSMFGLDNLAAEMGRVNDFLTDEKQASLIENVTRVTGETNSLVSTINNLFGSASRMLTDTMREFQSLLSEDKSHILKVFALGLLIYHYDASPEGDKPKEWRNWKVKMISLSLLNIYAWRKPLAEFPEGAARMITTLTAAVFKETGGPVIKVQSKDEGHKTMSSLVGVLYFIMTGGKAYRDGQEKTIIKLFTDVPRVTSGAAIFIEFATTVMKTLLSFVGVSLIGQRAMDWVYGPGEKRITDFEKRYEEIRDRSDRCDLEPTLANLEVVNELISEAKDIRKNFPRNGGNDVAASMADIIRELQSIRTLILARKPALEGRRVEPVGLYLAGPPGVFKTETLDWLSRALHHMVYAGKKPGCIDDTPSANIYAIRKSKYMDGIVDQKIIVFDDIMQDVDVAGQEDSEAKKIIDMINTPALRLNMADLSAKGTTYFKGEFVLASSNVPIPDPNSIVSAEALLRRFDLKYFVGAKDEYLLDRGKPSSTAGPMSRKVDKSLLPRRSNGDTVIRPMDVLEFTPYDTDGEPCGPPESFEDVLGKLLVLHHKKSVWYDNALEEINNYLTGFTPEEDRGFATSFTAYLSMNPVQKIKTLNEVSKFYDLDVQETNIERFERVLRYLNTHKADGEIYKPHDIYLLEKIHKDGIDHFDEVHPYGPEEVAVERNVLSSAYNKVTGLIWGQIVSSLKYGKQYFMSMLPKNWRFILSTSIAVLAAFSTTAVISNLIVSLWDVVIPQSTNPKVKERNITRNLAEEFKAMNSAPVAEVQSSNCSYSSMLDARIQKNLLSFEIEHPGGDRTQPGYALVLSGKQIIFPYHFITQMFASVTENPRRADYPVIFKSTTGRKHVITVSYVLENHYGSPASKSRDMIFLDLPELSQPHPDITNMFINSKDWARIGNRITSRIYTHNGNNLVIHTTPASFTTSTKVVDDEAGDSFVLEGLYTYDTVVRSGDCGAPFTCPNTGKILGFHVAGSPVAGFSKVFLADWIEENVSKPQNSALFEGSLEKPTVELEPNGWFKDLKNWSLPFDEPTLQITIEDYIIEDSGRKTIGTLVPSPTAPTKSTIIKSNMYGKLSVESLRLPSCLYSSQKDVLEYALSRYCVNTTKFDPHLLRSIAEKKLSHLKRTSMGKDYRKQIYTYRQAISGYLDPSNYGELKPLPGINLSTSSGFPGNVTGKAKKRDYFGDGEFPDFDNPESQKLERECESVIKSASKGVPSILPFTGFPKDELLKIQKVLDQRTRLISGSCMILIVCIKMYCDDFSIMLLENRIRNNSCLGISETSAEWDTLYKHLTKFGPQIIVGDFIGFDTCHTYALIMLVCSIINCWYDDSYDNQVIRIVLFQSIAMSTHIRDGKIEVWVGGMPSGNPLTSIINTLINEILMMFFYEKSTPKEVGPYHDNVVACFVGDDNGQGVSKEASQHFNGKTIERLALTIGYKFTSEDKDTEVQETKHICDSTFLKRRWRYDEHFGRVVGPISLETIYDMCAWGNKKTHSTIQHEKVDTALFELSLHGKEVYDRVGSEIIEVYYASYPGAGSLRNNSFIEIVERLTN